jgi:hypothetical protein
VDWSRGQEGGEVVEVTEPDAREMQKSGGETILVIDDEQLVRQLIIEVLATC